MPEQPMRLLKQTVRGCLIAASGPGYWSYRRWRRGFEEPELRVLPALCDESRVSLDVGANYGMYLAELRSLCRRCIAFEPLPELAQMLRRGFRDVDVHQVALSDREGTAAMRSPRLFTGYSTLETDNPMHAPTRDVRIVHTPVRRLDDIALDPIGFMKVDVEGHEEAVIAGARRTLARDTPNLILELEKRHKPGCIERVDATLRELGYVGLFIEHEAVHDLDASEILARQCREDPKAYVRNFIYVPRDRRARTLTEIERYLARSGGAL